VADIRLPRDKLTLGKQETSCDCKSQLEMLSIALKWRAWETTWRGL
jgi:hypothetical protein